MIAMQRVGRERANASQADRDAFDHAMDQFNNDLTSQRTNNAQEDQRRRQQGLGARIQEVFVLPTAPLGMQPPINNFVVPRDEFLDRVDQFAEATMVAVVEISRP